MDCTTLNESDDGDSISDLLNTSMNLFVGDNEKRPKRTAARPEKKARFAADVEVRTVGENQLSPTTDRPRVDVT